jgi:hypothetical protein
MNPFQKEIFIRLSEDGSAFACRIRYGKLFSKTTEFVIGEKAVPASVEETALVLIHRRSGRELHRHKPAWRSTSL